VAPSTSPAKPPPPPSAAPITEHELANAMLTFPKASVWGCASGRIKMSNGHYTGSGQGTYTSDPRDGLLKVISVGLEHNSNSDAVALFGCDRSDPGTQLVLGFRRAANGSIQTMGAVQTVTSTVHDIMVGSSGSVRLYVADIEGSTGGAQAGQDPQWRTYGWTGTRLTQTAGSPSFTVAAKLSVQLSDLTFAKSVNGKRTGTMTVTFHNTGSKAIPTHPSCTPSVTSPTTPRSALPSRSCASVQ
jgi:hypothetical protein